MNKQFWIKKIIGFTALAAALAAALGYTVMLLWNNVLAVVVPVSLISFWQALGLLLLSKILFGGFKSSWYGPKSKHWKNEMKEKWQGMSTEEREKLKQEWRNRCRSWKNQDSKEMAD